MGWCEDMATRATDARPVALRLAAAAQAAEAVGLAVAAVFAAVATADGKSYQAASGIALTLIAFGTAAGLAAFAVGLERARPWSRTPVVMTQLFVAGAGRFARLFVGVTPGYVHPGGQAEAPTIDDIAANIDAITDEAGYYVPTSTLGWSARYLSHLY